MSAQEVFDAVDGSCDGLSSAQAEQRLSQDGKNKLAQGKKKSLAKRLFEQFTDPMIIILIVAAVISAVTSIMEQEFPTDVIIILTVVIINAVLGVFQESKAEAAIEALQEMAAATSKVIRDGKVLQIKSEDLVKGDIISLEAGDSVPADARIIEAASLKIEEAALTGESVPANKIDSTLTLGEAKDIPLGDRKNMMYMGSTVVYGRGKAVVTDTGMNTEMGKIADQLAKAEDSQTPLQLKLAQLSKILSFIVIGICVFIFGFGIARQFIEGNTPSFDFYLDTFMVAVSLAVAAIPEGLAAVVTIVLSIGVTNMSKKNAIIRKLTAVETLGCAQIICSDKTGTLTQNKMTVVESFTENREFLAKAMALCTDVSIDEDGNVLGEPTECALVNFALSLDLNKNELLKASPRIAEAPFDSIRKMMTTVHKTSAGVVQFTKGAPDEILKRCTKILTSNGVRDINADDRQKILGTNKEYADKALRVLAAGFKLLDGVPQGFTPEDIENNLVFCGLTGMIDPVRPEVKDAIKECKSAGIRPIMITGDHKDTAVAIAKELGIVSDASQAITGADLNELSDDEFLERVGDFSVYARVQPEHKVRIVNAWRQKGCISAMTGDGVNDAPSIKSADIGIGMGITGTDVTKNVADMVLADDNFATIVSAIAEGRRIYDNIRKAIQFLLASNLSEVMAIFVANLIGFTILRPVHLLWINLITDSFPALALGLEKPESDIMTRKPRSSEDGIFAGGVGIDIAYQGVLVTALTVLAYYVGHFMETGNWNAHAFSSADGITMAFLTMSMCEIFHSLNMRSQRQSVIKMSLKGSHNKFIYLATLASIILTTAVIYVPFLKNAFGFTSISIKEYAVALGLAFVVIPVVEIVKAFQRLRAKKRDS